MGIKHFFMWFKDHFSHCIKKLPKKVTCKQINVTIDNLMIDMNGIFHNSAQKIYQYGNFKPKKRFLSQKNNKRPRGLQAQILIFKDVCSTIENLLEIVNPTKRLILCVDGPAPISKQNQQRQRRFRSANEREQKNNFDSNCITPGTKFMDFLSKYIDWYIRKNISQNIRWQNLEVILSNEKVPGEGEHKIINYIRHYGNEEETFCINGLDADLIMLALGTHLPHFYILREDLYDPSNEFFCIDIKGVSDVLANRLRWKSAKYNFIPKIAINDFVFMCYTVGNDFLPHIPSIEIIQDGIELLIEIYLTVGKNYGHLTEVKTNGTIKFIPNTLKIFLDTIALYEKSNLERKFRSRRNYFKDETLDSCSTQKGEKWIVDIDKYRQIYWDNHFKNTTGEQESICHQYLEGMQWVLSYYTRGVPNWKWHYRYHYAPTAFMLAKYVSTFTFPVYSKTIPSTPFVQLLSVLPPKSASLLPKPLDSYLLSDNSPLKKYCPKEITIDLAGKRREWEGIVLLPIVDHDLVRKCYFEAMNHINPKEIRRNRKGTSYKYIYNLSSSYLFSSYYGDIEDCRASTQPIEI